MSFKKVPVCWFSTFTALDSSNTTCSVSIASDIVPWSTIFKGVLRNRNQDKPGMESSGTNWPQSMTAAFERPLSPYPEGGTLGTINENKHSDERGPVSYAERTCVWHIRLCNPSLRKRVGQKVKPKPQMIVTQSTGSPQQLLFSVVTTVTWPAWDLQQLKVDWLLVTVSGFRLQQGGGGRTAFAADVKQF